MRSRLLLGLGLASLAAGAVNFVLLAVFRHDLASPFVFQSVRTIGVSWSFTVAGLVAGSRRPDNRTGVLMVAFGLAWSLHGLEIVPAPLAFALYVAVATVPDAILAHLIAVFPDGRATTRAQRLFLVVNYATTVPLSLLLLVLVSPDRLGCTGCPGDLLGVGGEHPYGGAALAVSNSIEVVLAGLLLWIPTSRWRRASVARRRSLAPVALVGAGLLVVYLISQLLAVALIRLPDPAPDLADLTILGMLLLWPLAFLAGLTRLRLDRAAASDLAARLDGPLPRGGLERALAEILHDPTLTVGYWSPDRRAFEDGVGRPVDPPAEGADRIATVLRHDGDPVATLLHAPVDDDELLRSVASIARMAIENERLHAEVRTQLAEVRASRARIVESGAAERRRVERNLHDGAQQRLVNLSLTLGMVRSQLGATPSHELAPGLDEAAAELRLAIAELRELARGIHPLILSEAGLGPALTSLAQRSRVPVQVADVPAGRLPERIEEAAYYVASEALTNAAKHSHATTLTLGARRIDGYLLVEVRDDGLGGADPHGSGLCGLADRVATVDGDLWIDSSPGHGTRITARLPCA